MVTLILIIVKFIIIGSDIKHLNECVFSLCHQGFLVHRTVELLPSRLATGQRTPATTTKKVHHLFGQLDKQQQSRNNNKAKCGHTLLLKGVLFYLMYYMS